MRVLHTSDWHIGRNFHGYSTLDAVRGVLGKIPEIVHEKNVDVVLIAGDVYDLTNPSADAVSVLQDTLVAILAAGAKVVLTSGNHDSAIRLGFASPFTAAVGLHFITKVSDVATPIEIADTHGPVDFYGIPYLQPELVRHLTWMPDDARSQREVMGAAMVLIRESIANRESRGRRSVVVAHTFVAGAESESSDSERAITKSPLAAGGVDAVPVNVFDGVDYVALGHIHGRAQLAEHVRYSGAVLHYSFKEANKPRGGWLVDLGAEGVDQIEWVDFLVPRQLKEIRGAFGDLLTDAQWEPFTDYYIGAVYTDKNKEIEPMQRLRTRFPYCADVVHEPTESAVDSASTYAERVKGKTDPEVAESFLIDVRNGDGSSETEQKILDEVIAERAAEVLQK
jgi:exonuclease SbcD